MGQAHARLVPPIRAHGRMIGGTSPWNHLDGLAWNEPMHDVGFFAMTVPQG
ncbi:MAG: hypothetical protein RIB43_12500 [Rhodospirillaceae bacterium]